MDGLVTKITTTRILTKGVYFISTRLVNDFYHERHYDFIRLKLFFL